MRFRPILVVGVLLMALVPLQADDRPVLQEVLQDHEVEGPWIYDDLAAGFAAARKSGKPLLVNFSCVP